MALRQDKVPPLYAMAGWLFDTLSPMLTSCATRITGPAPPTRQSQNCALLMNRERVESANMLTSVSQPMVAKRLDDAGCPSHCSNVVALMAHSPPLSPQRALATGGGAPPVDCGAGCFWGDGEGVWDRQFEWSRIAFQVDRRGGQVLTRGSRSTRQRG